MPNVSVNDPGFQAFVYGIKQTESSGNYQVVNSIGATGAYQILASNIPAWSKEVLGHSITQQQFLASPQLQDQIAQTKLLQYYNAYGPEGAARAWNTGSPTGKAQGNYVEKVMNFAKQFNGINLVGPDGVASLSKPATDGGDGGGSSFWSNLISGSFWKRIGLGALGAAILFFAAIMAFKSTAVGTKVSGQVTSGIKTVAAVA